MLEEIGPFVFIEIDQHLGVGASAEAVARPFQPPPEFGEVVDLAIEGDPHRAVFVGEGLLAARDIDDRQPPMAQSDAGHRAIDRLDLHRGQMHALAIRPAMLEHLHHPPQATCVDRFAGVGPSCSGNSTHDDTGLFPVRLIDSRPVG